jgi:hypothetical protein
MRELRFPEIRRMRWSEIALTRRLEAWSQRQPQVRLPVQHFLHAGVYQRTVTVPAGTMITGALVKIPTLLITNGEAQVYVGRQTIRLAGYNVIRAEPGRKQAFAALTDLHLTMVFASNAATVEQAEAEFTDEVELLQSRRLLPGEDKKCLE